MDIFASLFIITFIIVFVVIWFLISYTLYRIGRKFQIGSFWGYCVPIYNGYLIYKCADVPLWNFVGLFIPILNIYCFVNIWGSIAERLRQELLVLWDNHITFRYPCFHPCL